MNFKFALSATFLLALLCHAQDAAAEERVPRITNAQLPVVGTCAPIRRTDVTHVMVGERTTVSWFRIAGLQGEPLEFEALVALLKSRAGTARPSTHAVWITASADHAWIHAMRVREACLAAGIYRVGLRVRSEATDEVMGFPIFLAPGASGTPTAKGGLLRVRVNTLGANSGKEASDAGHVYKATRLAQAQCTKIGAEQIVASLWIATNAPLQYALRCLDLLYRGGCAGVKLRSGRRVPPLKYKAIPKIEIQGVMISRLPPSMVAPPVQPRQAPWSLDGAAKPGWVDLELVDLPAKGAGGAAPASKPKARPNYAARPEGVPSHVRGQVDAQARAWSQRLGSDLLAGLRGGQGLKDRFVVALRRNEVLPGMLGEARRQFPDATRVEPATLQFNLFLFQGASMRGRADITLLTVGDRLRIVTGSWRPLDPGASYTVTPFPVDPFAAGEPSAWRIWFEGLFHDVRTRGRAAWPLATPERVTPFFPASARPGVAGAIQGRGAALAQLTQRLAGTSYDRLVLAIPRGTATVFAGNQVVGVLNFGLTSEEQELRLDEFSPRRGR